ncbi:MAG: LysR family transcriptional regulator [Burkholderiales bacterium]|nr:LysR family transcriptional regulator [Burkholderiales bacterium]
MSSITQLKNFVTIVDQNSFSKAAKILCQSNPSTSRQLNELEEDLGHNLITRSTRTLELTDFGRLYYLEAKDLLKQYDNLEQMASLYKDEPAGILKISTSQISAKKLIIPYLAEFHKMYPKIVPQINVTRRIPQMHKDGIDIAIAMDYRIEGIEENTNDVVKKFVYDSTVILCCSPQYAATRGIPTTPLELQDHAYITSQDSENPKQIPLKNNIMIDVEPELYINSAMFLIECAENHLGIISVIRENVEESLQAGKLIHILQDYDIQRKIFMYYKKNRYLEPKVKKFVDFIFSKL